MPHLEAQADHQAEQVEAVARRLLGGAILSAERLGGGGNGRTYRVAASDGRFYALKQYYRGQRESRDRLAAEFEGLQFLWRHGIRDVPEPLACDAASGFALYEFAEGQKLPAGALAPGDVEAAADFLGRLKALTGQPGSQRIALAAEACFSTDELLGNLSARLDRHLRRRDAEEVDPALAEFLGRRFLPVLDRVAAWCVARAPQSGLLPQAWRTLSPSDFGFHNAVRRACGAWCFLDFEYFGWDDPAKMISDFLLHPAMALAEAQKRLFVCRLLRHFHDDAGLEQRLARLYPLFGLKWCVILLNEFLPEHLRRRRFAATCLEDQDAVRQRQLAKARRMLDQVCNEYEHFPYLD
jgi:hypothetical protein